MIAPTLVPTKAGDRVKTDRRDAERLARCYRAGELTAVWVPDASHEALRDLVRAREAAKQDQLRARHRLGKFLLRHGKRPPQNMRAWVATEFFRQVRDQARERGLLSDEHFTVDGTLIEAWASQKSFQPKDQGPQDTGQSGSNPEVDFRGVKRSNTTHQSTTDPDARLLKKSAGGEARLSYMGHVLMENRNGLVVDSLLTIGSGTAEREAACAMLDALGGSKRITVGADKAYDVPEFVGDLREMRVTPHVAQKREGSSIDTRTARHGGYAMSQKARKRVEEIFGWMKTVGGHRKTRYRGTQRVSWAFTFTAAAYNLVRMRNLESNLNSA